MTDPTQDEQITTAAKEMTAAARDIDQQLIELRVEFARQIGYTLGLLDGYLARADRIERQLDQLDQATT